ncbi:glucose-6-phosphate isomerase family protein [Poriferisphaera sp. WC338]|uniref:glucose-6-phosphate isomerase family protein n=1 Tax=Poriferisphaera sp. WC338 TaxID=3425129 RepID=UPI003D8161A5
MTFEPTQNTTPSPLLPAAVCFDGCTGELGGGNLNTPLQKLRRTIGDLIGVFADQQAYNEIAPGTLAYEANLYLPVKQGTQGGLFFGNTKVMPMMIGNEYNMTKGHFHKNRDAAEYYWCIAGEGALILMNEDRSCRAEYMTPGSLHYIPGRTAHRVANIGKHVLTLGACWPADAGHDYETIAKQGFSARLLCVNGKPQLVDIDKRENEHDRC